MWGEILLVNGILFAISSTYLVYSIGMAFLVGAWKQFLIALLLTTFFAFAEVALGALSEP